MATVQNIIDRAAQRSNLNDASLISSTEAIAYVSSFEQQIYLEAARENPDYFGREGVSATRGSATATWDISTTPGNIAAVSRVEISGVNGAPTSVSVGDEVTIISIRNPQHGIAPRAYIRNRTIHEYNTELQDSASAYANQLKIFYSWLPTTRTATTDNLDLPDEHLALVELKLAMLFAVRDQRPDEIPALQSEFEMHYATFLQAVSAFDEATVRELSTAAASSRRLGG
jgi:hypothetical protein|tara:strand:+ start:3437 stop:4123 length:687 start_codon:yes stop_codon:yes gene_type:complete